MWSFYLLLFLAFCGAQIKSGSWYIYIYFFFRSLLSTLEVECGSNASPTSFETNSCLSFGLDCLSCLNCFGCLKAIFMYYSTNNCIVFILLEKNVWLFWISCHYLAAALHDTIEPPPPFFFRCNIHFSERQRRVRRGAERGAAPSDTGCAALCGKISKRAALRAPRSTFAF